MCRICHTQYNECVQERKHTPPSATSILQSHSEGVSPKQSASHTRETWQGIHCCVHPRSTQSDRQGIPLWYPLISHLCSFRCRSTHIPHLLPLQLLILVLHLGPLGGGGAQHSTDTGIWRRKRKGIGLVKLGPSQSWYTSFISVAKYPP